MVAELDEAMTSTHDLWVHQESAIIGADSHDIWGFTPEFLLSNGIVRDDCLADARIGIKTESTSNTGP